jgi:PKD repeat protein
MRWTAPVLLCALALFSLPSSASAQEIALVASCNGQSCEDVRSFLRDTGRFRRVDVFDINARLPTPTDLRRYDSLLVFTGAGFEERDELGDLLADFVDTGGGVVTAPLSQENGPHQLRGRYYNERYAGLIYSDTMFQATSLGATLTEDHPVLRGVSDLRSGAIRSTSNAVWTGSYRVANWNDGRPVAVAREDRDGRTLDVTFFPASDAVDDQNWPRESDGATFWANALLWAARNLPPEVEVGDGVVALEGADVMASVVATDANGDTVIVGWDLDGNGLHNDATGQEVAIPVLDGPASYEIEIEVSDGHTSILARVPVQIENAAPSIDTLGWVESAPVEMTPVTFSAAATDPAGDRDSLTYAWTFPGEVAASGPDAVFTFPQDGTYTVTLTVSDEDGGGVRRNMEVAVLNAPPALESLDVDQVDGDEGSTFNFRVVANDVDPLTYRWEFGDGQGADGASSPHVYRDEGEYVAVVTVEDDAGGSMTSERAVTVRNVAPTAGMIVAPATVQANEAVSFKVTASDPGDDALTYAWDFGDDTPAQTALDLDAVHHAYTAAGEYTVILTVDDGDGGTDTQAHRLVVEGQSAPPQGSGGSSKDGGCQTASYASLRPLRWILRR